MQLSVLIPCYNEVEIIEENFNVLSKELDKTNLSYEIIFCNDGSTDATLEVLKKIQGINPNVKLINYDYNRGAGYAYQKLYRACCGEIAIQMDADFSMRPGDTIPIFLKEINNADVVVGSRYKGIKASYPLKRRLASRIYSGMNRLFFGLRVRDTQSGFIAFRKEVFSMINIESYGFEALLELFVKLKMQTNFRVKEVPIKFTHETLTGETDIFYDGIKMFKNTLKIWLKFMKNRIGGKP